MTQSSNIELIGNEYRFKGTPAEFAAVAKTFGNRIGQKQGFFILPRTKAPSIPPTETVIFPELYREEMDFPAADSPFVKIEFGADKMPFGNLSKITAQSLPDKNTMLTIIFEHDSKDEDQVLWNSLLIELKRQGWIDKPLPTYPQALAKYSGTDAKMQKLRRLREKNIKEGNVTISRTEACLQANKLSPKTAKKADPELWAKWNDPNYR